MVVVALGEPGVPVICWAVAGMIPSRAKPVDVRSKRRDWFIVTPYTLRGVINITASVCSPPCDNPHVMSAKGQERTSRPASRMSAKCHKQTGTSLIYPWTRGQYLCRNRLLQKIDALVEATLMHHCVPGVSGHIEHL